MNRAQRVGHRWLWFVLAPLLVGAVAYALIGRGPPISTEDPPSPTATLPSQP